MSTAREWPVAVKKAWVCWEMLRRLNFSSDDIRVGAVRGVVLGATTQVVRVQLDVQGKVFGIHAALWDDAPEAFEPIWREFAEWANAHAAPPWNQELLDMYAQYAPEFSATGLVLAIVEKGIVLPAREPLPMEPPPKGTS